MHSVIERTKKKMQIYSPLEWPALIRCSKMSKPYMVNCLTHNDIVDLKQLFDEITCNDLKQDSNKDKVPWMNIKWLRFLKNEGNIIY